MNSSSKSVIVQTESDSYLYISPVA
ncbi:MAG: hypothetical protein K0R67_2430, partial [Paenibacillus sp.]|nr:hypothetical protein [Paenibacillus sp.]